MSETIETTKELEENSEPLEENIMEKNQAEKPQFDYRKEREERIKHKVEKAFLSEIGASSFDEIKEKISALDDYKKQIGELKNEISMSKVNGYKIEVLKSGFDERFVDFIVYELKDKVSESEDFSKLLKEFKEKNSQFLKDAKPIKYSTAPNLSGTYQNSSISKQFNDAILKRIYKEK